MKKLILAALVLLATAASAQTLKINGAGATFPNPIYTKWFDQYHNMHPNVEINYQSIGSGGGIRQLSAGTVFFGASDGPMTNDQITAAGFRILHLPTVLGGVVPVYICVICGKSFHPQMNADVADKRFSLHPEFTSAAFPLPTQPIPCCA
jgi:phosphate transport system substrate-binding protein